MLVFYVIGRFALGFPRQLPIFFPFLLLAHYNEMISVILTFWSSARLQQIKKMTNLNAWVLLLIAVSAEWGRYTFSDGPVVLTSLRSTCLRFLRKRARCEWGRACVSKRAANEELDMHTDGHRFEASRALRLILAQLGLVYIRWYVRWIAGSLSAWRRGVLFQVVQQWQLLRRSF